jgi:hypothetical protein
MAGIRRRDRRYRVGRRKCDRRPRRRCDLDGRNGSEYRCDVRSVGSCDRSGSRCFARSFHGRSQKKKDKKENIPALRQGFTDAFKELNQILSDIRSLRIDPDEAITRAADVRSQIAGGFGVQFLSKKYRKQAQQEIASNLGRADSIINEIKSSAEIARGAADRSQRILPEFAGGHYFADFFKPNGLVPGMFDGRDNILAMISRGEMVLNPDAAGPRESSRRRRRFRRCRHPELSESSSSASARDGRDRSTGLSLSTTPPVINFSPNFMLELHGVHIDDSVEAFLVSDKGVRTQIKVAEVDREPEENLSGTGTLSTTMQNILAASQRSIDNTLQLTFPDSTVFRFRDGTAHDQRKYLYQRSRIGKRDAPLAGNFDRQRLGRHPEQRSRPRSSRRPVLAEVEKRRSE